jgi:hypothetical protein
MMKRKREPTKKTKLLIALAVKYRKETWSFIRKRNKSFRKAVTALLEEGFPLRVIGDHFGLSGQYIGKMLAYWAKEKA